MGFSQGIMPNKSSFVTGQATVTKIDDVLTAEPLTKESLTGTLTFINGETAVAGSGTAFTTELEAGDRISLDADKVWVEIESIESVTALTLTEAYTGTGGIGDGSKISSVPIPDGCWLTIIAKPGNEAGIIYLGNSKDNAEAAATRFDGLEAGLAVALKVADANLVWVNSNTDGIGVSYIAEQ